MNSLSRMICFALSTGLQSVCDDCQDDQSTHAAGIPVGDVCSGALVVGQGCNDIAQCTQGLVDFLALLQPLA